MNKIKKIILITLFLNIVSLQAAGNLIFKSSKYSTFPITILIFRNFQDAEGWVKDTLYIAAYKAKTKETIDNVSGKIWDYAIKPLAKAVAIPGPAVDAAEKGSNAFANWIDDKILEKNPGNPEEKYRKGLPPAFTIKPNQSKEFSAAAIKKMGPFKDKVTGNTDRMAIVVVDSKNNIINFLRFPKEGTAIALAMKNKIGKQQAGFNITFPNDPSKQNDPLWPFNQLADIVMDKYNVREYFEEIEKVNAVGNRISLKQVKEWLKTK